MRLTHPCASRHPSHFFERSERLAHARAQSQGKSGYRGLSRPLTSLQNQEVCLAMRSQLENRLRTLQAEYEAGQKALAHLEAQKALLKETLLRIGGAIQVLQEELETSPDPQPLAAQADQSATPAQDLNSVGVTPAQPIH